MGKTRKTMKYQVQERLFGMEAYGHSKHMDKAQNGGKPALDKIYSYSTMSNYMDASVRFARWAKETYGCRDLQSAEKYTGEYLQHRMDSGRSAWTVRRDAAALAKLYQKGTGDLGAVLPKRSRADVTQHRGSVSAGKFSEARNKDLVDFCRSTGLRRHEVGALRPEDVQQRPDGSVFVHVNSGKGGKARIVQALNSRPAEIAAARSCGSGSGKLFDNIPCRAPIHAYRREYAQELYRQLARPIGSLSKSEVYRCRKDMGGVSFDKQAMKTVSEMLGHNRLDVMTTYLKES